MHKPKDLVNIAVIQHSIYCTVHKHIVTVGSVHICTHALDTLSKLDMTDFSLLLKPLQLKLPVYKKAATDIC